MTNAEFSEADADFRKACDLAGIAPTKVGARKWRHQKGRAWETWQALHRQNGNGAGKLSNESLQAIDTA